MNRKSKYPHYSPYIMLALAITYLNCASLHLQNIPQTTTPQWPQFGRSPQRSNSVNQTFSFPLEEKWQKHPSLAIGPTLIGFDDAMFYHSFDGKIHAVRIHNGKKLGTIKLKKKQVGTAAYIDSTLIIVRRQWQPALQRYHLKSGKTLWKRKGGTSFADPLIVDNRIYVSYHQKKLVCYILENGDIDWSIDLPAPSRTTPTWAQGLVLVGTNQGVLYACKNGDIDWSFATKGALRAAATYFNGQIFIGSTDGYFYALNAKNGKKIWDYKTGGKIYHAAAVHDQNIIFGSTDHTVYSVNRKTGKLAWTFKAKSVISTSPVCAPNAVFFGSLDKHLYALDPADGKKIWSFEAKGRIRTHPIIVNQNLLFASEEERLYCFE